MHVTATFTLLLCVFVIGCEHPGPPIPPIPLIPPVPPVPSKVWICNGNESKRYAILDSERVWTGTDSAWIQVFNGKMGSNKYDIVNRAITITAVSNGRFVVNNLVYAAGCTIGGPIWDTVYTKWDTLPFWRAGTYYVGYSGCHSGKGVDIELDYDSLNNRVHLLYDWYSPGPSYSDCGSTITLDGVRQ